MADNRSFLDDIGEKMKGSGRKAIAYLHAHGVPAVYMLNGEMVWEYPGGTILKREQKNYVDQAIANQRLAGLTSDPAPVAMTAKVVAGLVTNEELQTWINERVAEIKNDAGARAPTGRD